MHHNFYSSNITNTQTMEIALELCPWMKNIEDVGYTYNEILLSDKK